MCAEALSQEEIDALLRNHGPASALPAELQAAVETYVETFIGAFEEVGSRLLGQPVQVEMLRVDSLNVELLPSRCPVQLVLLSTQHEHQLQGEAQLVLAREVALALAAAMTGRPNELGEPELKALTEATAQVFNRVCTQLQVKSGLETRIAAVTAGAGANTDKEMVTQLKSLPSPGAVAALEVRVGDLSGPALLVLSNPILSGLVSGETEESPGGRKPSPSRKETPRETVRPVVFESLQGSQVSGRPGNLDLILDISMDVRVQLGRTTMKIRDILELGPGAVIELDKLAGEPVDLLVNDKLFARGEVVVIDENFGVRVTDIINIRDRIEALGES